MAEIKIVTGLNYGDESKGLVANAVSTPTCLNILPSNSCQRAHTVVENGVRRVFRHFGSGTLKGAATYFSEEFMVNPAMFRREWEELEAMGITPKVYAKIGGVMVSPVDMFANVNVEERRGDKSHSSTGCGVWESLNRHRVCTEMAGTPHYHLDTIIKYYEDVLRDKDGTLPEDVTNFLHGEYLEPNIDEDFQWFYDHITLIKNDTEEKALLHSYPLLVFENGQGLLLADDHNYDFEHNTPAYVGAKVPSQIIAQNFDKGEVDIETLYVTRTYLTRHGKGQIGQTSNLECDKAAINADMFDATNVPNPNQGTLRYGKFDQREANAAVARAIRDSKYFEMKGIKAKPSLVVTHTNEFAGTEILTAAEGKINLYTSDNESTIKSFK
jgi:adenylosuccinate synthase